MPIEQLNPLEIVRDDQDLKTQVSTASLLKFDCELLVVGPFGLNSLLDVSFDFGFSFIVFHF